MENVWAIDLPEAWFISAVSDKGRPQFKRKPLTRERYRKYNYTHRVSWVDFIGGWVVEDIENHLYTDPQRFMFGAKPFPTYMAAILATEIELSNLK